MDTNYTSGSTNAPGRDHPLYGVRRHRLPHPAKGQLRPLRRPPVLEGQPGAACFDGAFCQPLPEEMVDRGIPFGPKYVAIEQLADQAKSIRPAAEHIQAMKQRDELGAAARIKSIEALKADFAQRQAEVNAELA